MGKCSKPALCWWKQTLGGNCYTRNFHVDKCWRYRLHLGCMTNGTMFNLELIPTDAEQVAFFVTIPTPQRSPESDIPVKSYASSKFSCLQRMLLMSPSRPKKLARTPCLLRSILLARLIHFLPTQAAGSSLSFPPIHTPDSSELHHTEPRLWLVHEYCRAKTVVRSSLKYQ